MGRFDGYAITRGLVDSLPTNAKAQAGHRPTKIYSYYSLGSERVQAVTGGQVSTKTIVVTERSPLSVARIQALSQITIP